ncbi:MAG: hypothetical protein WDO68_01165 [Gammaproteobacteria bacterium]
MQERGGHVRVAVIRRPVKRGGSIRLSGVHIRFAAINRMIFGASPRMGRIGNIACRHGVAVEDAERKHQKKGSATDRSTHAGQGGCHSNAHCAETVTLQHLLPLEPILCRTVKLARGEHPTPEFLRPAAWLFPCWQ